MTQDAHPLTHRPRLADVAKAANVSVPTVSRVLKGTIPVSEEKRRRVMNAVARLQYRPNAAAQALVQGSRSSIAVITGNTTRYGYAATLRGVEEAARSAGYSVVISVLESADHNEVSSTLDLVLAQAVAGVVVLDFDTPGSAAAAAMPSYVPLVVAAGSGGVHTSAPRVVLDDEAGSKEACTYLLSLGHQTVHHVAIPNAAVGPRGREVGWRETLQAAGITPPPLVDLGWGVEAGYRAGRVLAQDRSVTAITVGNDELAIGVIRALNDTGHEVPNDISVTGFDDEPYAAMWRPALTTVRQDFVELGQKSFAQLAALINGDTPEAEIRLTPHLVLRESVAPPRP